MLLFKVVEASLDICWHQHLPALCVSTSYQCSANVPYCSQFHWPIQTFCKIWFPSNLFQCFLIDVLLFGMHFLLIPIEYSVWSKWIISIDHLAKSGVTGYSCTTFCQHEHMLEDICMQHIAPSSFQIIWRWLLLHLSHVTRCCVLGSIYIVVSWEIYSWFWIRIIDG